MPADFGAAGQKVVKSQPDGDGEAAPRTVFVNRQQDFDRLDQLRQMLQQPRAVPERFANQVHVQSLQIT